MRADLTIGETFPDLRLPETTGRELALSEIADARPLVLAFVRGWWCPKEQGCGHHNDRSAARPRRAEEPSNTVLLV